MIKLLRKSLVIAMMLGVVSAGAFAQRKGQDKDKRPPKDPVKVVTNDRKEPRPPRNDNREKPKPGKPNRP